MKAWKPIQSKKFALQQPPSRVVVFFIASLVFLQSAGCQNWPGTQQANLFQQDSDRLLNEFRAEKKRADDLAAKNRILEQRLAESEKGIARQNLAGGRPMQRPSDSSSRISIGGPSDSAWNGLSNTDSSRNGQFRSQLTRQTGLPDAKPGTDARFTASGLNAEASDKDRPSLLQWRPIRK